MASDYFPVHAHSEWSWLDGMGTVEQMVATAVRRSQPALALTDHGVMAGAIRLYKECRRVGIAPFPGEEFYVVPDVEAHKEESAANRKMKLPAPKRYHIGLLALNQTGFKGLIRLSSRSHERERFYKKPLIDFQDLAELSQGAAKGVALTTGCYFGLPIQMMVEHGDPAAAKRIIEMYARWFPYTFVELQNHKIDHDDITITRKFQIKSDAEIVAVMMDVADELGLPVVAGQDSHYCEMKDKPAHNMMKSICYHGGEGEDFAFPGDSFHMASTRWVKKHYLDSQWDRIEEGHERLLDLNKLRLPELDKYQFHVPEVSKAADSKLERMVNAGMHKLGFDLWQHYIDRAKKELLVIKQMGFANYFLVVEDVTTWCRKSGIIVNARGSANGSLVCFILGITEVDPIQWKTSFDRFLSLDRKKPPDIDLDIESSRRIEVIDYVRSKFPSMVHQGTYSRLGITEEEDGFGGQDRGSVFVQYRAAQARRGGNPASIPAQDREALQQLASLRVRKAPGVHSAGLVLPGKGLAINDYLATMLVASSGTTVTQSVMEDVEDAGYCKLDLLGLRTLETLSNCLELIGKKRGDLSWIPFDDKKATQLLRSGATDGVFQFEGYATRKGGKQMQVRSTLDAIFCLALYRPALMNGGQTERYVQHRKAKTRETLHPIIDRIMDDTRGVPIFQEQVMDIMRAIQMPYEDLNDLMKAVKASNDKIEAYAQDTFDRIKPLFVRLACQAGMDKPEAEEAWRIVMDFSDYGFNRAHATSYGLMAYKSAYLKAYYPLEYMAALMTTWAGTDKEKVYITEARRLNITIIRPDVNNSGLAWTVDKSRKTPSLRKGLLTIKGIGYSAAQAIVGEREANGPYKDLHDFIERLPARPVSGGREYDKTGELKGVMKVLRDAGALRCIGLDREA